ncbi:MAG TPA: hypothetical protein PKL29_00075 [Methanothrix sp.]|nr:hypothetical protein [Methanothrix sp.]HPT36688.1 hypothetical protein [Methanothrix sp.]
MRVFNKIEKTVWEISDEGTLKHLQKYPEKYEIGPAKGTETTGGVGINTAGSEKPGKSGK